jgi:hypothetical protein
LVADRMGPCRYYRAGATRRTAKGEVALGEWPAQVPVDSASVDGPEAIVAVEVADVFLVAIFERSVRGRQGVEEGDEPHEEEDANNRRLDGRSSPVKEIDGPLLERRKDWSHDVAARFPRASEPPREAIPTPFISEHRLYLCWGALLLVGLGSGGAEEAEAFLIDGCVSPPRRVRFHPQ